MRNLIKHTIASVLALSLAMVALTASAQFGPPPAGPVTNAKEGAPHDVTGYWVSLVTEDWRFRIITAVAGDFEGVPLTDVGREKALAWDPVADEAAGQACLAYGVGGIMRMPTRLHITWLEDNILSIETDSGMQTRLLKFAAAQDGAGAGSWQGVSNASWELQRAGGFGPVVNGSIAVTTTDMKAGYFRRNGLPYSEESTINEYFEMVTEENGDQYLIVISVLEDPINLTETVLTSTNFKRETDASKWNPSECVTQ